MLVFFGGDWDVHWGYDLVFDPWPNGEKAEGADPQVGLELGDWLAGQRVRAAEGQLGPERFQRLQEPSERMVVPLFFWGGHPTCWLVFEEKPERKRSILEGWLETEQFGGFRNFETYPFFDEVECQFSVDLNLFQPDSTMFFPKGWS